MTATRITIASQQAAARLEQVVEQLGGDTGQAADPNQQLALTLLETATAAVQAKQRLVHHKTRIAITRRLHAREQAAMERDLTGALQPLFSEQVKSIARRLEELGGTKELGELSRKYHPGQPRDDHGRWTSSGGGLSFQAEPFQSEGYGEYARVAGATRPMSDEEISKQEQLFAGRLTPDQRRALFNYADDNSVNAGLRENKLDDLDRQQVELIDAAIGKGKIPRNMHLHRVISFPESEGDIETMQGQVIRDSAYLSTSAKSDVYRRMASERADETDDNLGVPQNYAVMRIYAPRGAAAAFIGGVVDASDAEVLLPRNAALKIHEVRVIKNPSYMVAGRKTYSILAEYLSETNKSRLGGTKSTTDNAQSLMAQVFDAHEWRAELVDRALPVMVLHMARAAVGQMITLGVDPRRKAWERRTGRKSVEQTSSFTKVSTATQWLSSRGDYAAEWDELVQLVEAAGLDISVLTELPEWMKRDIRQKLRNSFAEPYWDDISRTTAGDAERVLMEGLQNGWSIRRMAIEMASSFQGSTARYAEMRATRIARTEAGGALNGARRGAIDQLINEVGPEVPIRPAWMSVLGTTTRDTHARLDGVPCDKEGMWNLSGYRVPYPGHIRLPPEERCNCQCTIALEFGMQDTEAQQLIQEYVDRQWEDEAGVADLRLKFNPSQPRVPAGSTEGGQFAGDMAGTVRSTDGHLMLGDGQPLPAHLPKIPPGWTDVRVSLDKESDLWVTGRDKKGREQRVYSDAHWARQAEVKFARVNELRSKQREIEKEINQDIRSKDLTTREAASCLRLINATGLRPGSTADTGAEKQAYGATTLEGKHVQVVDGQVRLRFVGKKGVDLDIAVTDKRVADDLVRRADRAGPAGKLFNVNDGQLRTYSLSKDGGGFKPKDFRTARGTNTAVEAMRGMPVPRTTAEYKRAVRRVAKLVSEQLGNTPTVAMQSYIDPSIFARWRKAAKVKSYGGMEYRGERWEKWSPGQPRDDHGRFATGGGSSGAGGAGGGSGSGGGGRSDAPSSKDMFTEQELGLPKGVRHQYDSEEKIYAVAPKAKESYDNSMDRGQGVDRALGGKSISPSSVEEFAAALESTGPVVVLAPLKSYKRAGEKVDEDYDGDWGKLTDVVRGTVAVDTKGEIPGAVRAVKERMAQQGFELACKPANRMETPVEGGYRDIMLKFKTPEGLVAEVQVNTKYMLYAKEVGPGHKLYEEYRTIVGSAKKSKRPFTPEESKRLKVLTKQSQELYDRVWSGGK